MGLASAYHLLKQGHAVSLYEADNQLGGMSASFVFNGIKIERYYHFICKSDQPMFDMLAELGIENTLRWNETRMGYFYQGKLRNWGDPTSQHACASGRARSTNRPEATTWLWVTSGPR